MRGTLLRVDTPAGLRRHGRTATVRVELNGARGPESFISRLADLSYVSGVQAHDNALVVEMADPPHETPDLVAELVAAGARITSVVEEAQTLEEAYLALVGEIGERDTDR
jgi:ABC-type multidrug transport system ATPase subunit